MVRDRNTMSGRILHRALLVCSGVLLLLLLTTACSLLDQVRGTAQPPTATTPPAPTTVPVALLSPIPSTTPVTVAVASPLPTMTPLPTTTDIPTLPAAASPVLSPSPTTLTLWVSDEAEMLEPIQLMVAELARQRGLTITVVPKPPGTLRTDMIAADLGGRPLPGLIWGNQDDLAELLIDSQLTPAGSLVQPDLFLQAAITGATSGGQVWGVPLTVQDHMLLISNRSLVAQPLETTDALIAQSRAMEGSEQYGCMTIWSEARWFIAWLNGSGGALTTPDGTRPTLNTPEMINALNLLLELHRAAPPDEQSSHNMTSLFNAGRVAVVVDGDWALTNYQNLAPAVDMGVAPMPRVPATGRRAAPLLDTTYLMLRRHMTAEEQMQAQAFAALLTEPATQLRIATMLGRLPALRSTLTDPLITSNATLSVAAAQAEDASGLPPTSAGRCALRAINTQLPALLDGDIDQQQAAEAMQKNAEACMTY